MAFQVKELMVALEPTAPLSIPTTKPCSCVYPSNLAACGNTEAQCPTASALGFAVPDSRRNLELLLRDLAARNAN